MLQSSDGTLYYEMVMNKIIDTQVFKLFLSFVSLSPSFCILLSTFKLVTCICFASCLPSFHLGPSLHTFSPPFAMYSTGRISRTLGVSCSILGVMKAP